MRLTSFVVSKSWASNPLRTALTLLGIALGVAIVVAIYVMDHNTIQSRMAEQRLDRGPVDLEVRPLQPGHPAAKVLADLLARPRVQKVAAFVEAAADLEVAGRRVGSALVFGIDPLPGAVTGHYRVAAGSDLTGPGQVLLGTELARAAGIAAGDRLLLRSPARGRRVRCVNGVQIVEQEHGEEFAAEVEVAGLLAYEGLGRRGFGAVAVAPLALARSLAPGAEPVYHLWRAYGADLDRLRAELESDYLVLDRRSARIGEGADERAFRNGVKLLGCLALVLGMFVVFQTLSHSLVERLRQLGLLRCLGATRGSLAGIFLVDALALGVFGSVSGIAAGIGLAAWLRAGDVSSLGLGKPWLTFELPPGPILWTGALGVLFTLAGAAFPLWKARALPPLQVLQGPGLEGPAGDVLRGVNRFLFVLLVGVLPLAYLAMTPLVAEEGRETRIVLLEMGGLVMVFGGILLLAPRVVSILGSLLLWPLRALLPLASFLVHKTLRRNPGRHAAAVCGLAVVLLALLTLKSITAALRGEVQQFAAVALEDRLFLEVEPLPLAAAEVLRQVPGVVEVDPIRGRVERGFVLSGLPVEALGRAGGALESDPEALARFADPERRGLVVSRRLAAMKGWQPGSLVAVATDSGPVAYTVLAVSDRSGYVPSERAFAVTAPHWLRRDFCADIDTVRYLALSLAPGSNVRALQDKVRAVLPGVTKSRPGSWIRDYHLRDVTRDFRLFDLLLALIFLLAVVGLVNGMTIAALGRIREIGVLRALGMGRWALVRTFLLEGALVAALACLLALALAVPLGRVVVGGLNTVAGLSAPYVTPWRWIAATPLLAAAVALLSAVLPGLRAARQSPAESVRYE